MNEQHSKPETLLAGQTFAIHHLGGAETECTFLGVDGSRCQVAIGLAGTYEFWLFSEGAHFAGHCVFPEMLWWRMREEDMRRVRGHYSSLRSWRKALRRAAVSADEVENERSEGDA